MYSAKLLMIGKTYYIENPAYLNVELDQLVIRQTEGSKETRPLDDAGMLIIDHHQVTLTSPLLQILSQNQVGLVVCNQKHLPCGIWLPLSGHIQTGGRSRTQLESKKPLNKQLWQVIVRAKIINQGSALKKRKRPSAILEKLSLAIRSGDTTNGEATAAAYYWKNWCPEIEDFRRDPEGEPPNNLLNFGYAVLRSMAARYLIGSGLWPVYGIFHRNQYNHLPLADDIMEPFRPFLDDLVLDILEENPQVALDYSLSKEVRSRLLTILVRDVSFQGNTRPLQVAMQLSCAALVRAYEEKSPSLLHFPTIII